MCPRRIEITPVLNGFIAVIGCQTVVFNTPDQLGSEIARYYKSPDAVEKEFISKAVNKTMENHPNLAYPSVPVMAARHGEECDQCAAEPTPTLAGQRR